MPSDMMTFGVNRSVGICRSEALDQLQSIFGTVDALQRLEDVLIAVNSCNDYMANCLLLLA